MSIRDKLVRVVRVLVGSIAFTAFAAAHASAGPIAITEADFVNPTTLTFAATGPDTASWGGVFPPYIESGVAFSTSPPEFFYTYDPGSSGDNILDLYLIANAASSLDVSFGQAVSKFGFHAGTNPESRGSGMADYDVTSVMFYSDSGFANLIATYNTSTRLSDAGQMFYGLSSADPFQSIRINLSAPGTGGGFSPYMDDFLFESTAAAVPEPAAMAMFGMGLLFVSAKLRRRSAPR